MNFSSDLRNVANSRPSALNFICFSRSLDQFFLTVVQNNFGYKIPFLKKKLPHGFEAFLAHFDGQLHGLGQLLERISLDPHHLGLGLPNRPQPHGPLYRHT